MLGRRGQFEGVADWLSMLPLWLDVSIILVFKKFSSHSLTIVTNNILSDVYCSVLPTLYCLVYFVLSIVAIQPLRLQYCDKRSYIHS